MPILLVAIASGAIAQQPAPPVRPATPPAAGAPSVKKIPGLSDDGNAIYAKVFGTPDPQLLATARQQRQVQSSITGMAMGTTVNVDKLADLLKQRDALQLQFRTRQNELTIAMLRQLTDDDRGIYLRYAMTPPPPPAPR
ncbi:hypothetical protein [Sphingomonas sp. MMS24-J13]|uniref:hypothetical protein n=1 Tax=Sphingomonas sp. MMS24-J13 TaxID=3238686 RepID=UPI00384DCDE2